MSEQASVSRKLGRKLSRRLSLVTKVPNLIGTKLKSEFGSRDSLAFRRRDNRQLEITIIAPDKSQRTLHGQSPETVCGLVSLLLAEYCVVCPRLTLAGSRAEVDPCADISLLEGDILIVEETFHVSDPRSDVDPRFRLTEQFWHQEESYVQALLSLSELYGYPLRKIGCLTPDEHEMLFEPTSTLAAVCSILVQQMKQLLQLWSSSYSSVGQLFSKQWWSQYEEYQETYRRTRRFLREKTLEDDDFLELCKLRQGAAKYSLPALLDLPATPILCDLTLEGVSRHSRATAQESHLLDVRQTCRVENNKKRRKSDSVLAYDLPFVTPLPINAEPLAAITPVLQPLPNGLMP